MTRDGYTHNGWVAFTGLLGFVVGFWVACWAASNVIEEKALSQGHAEVVDGEFRWLPPCNDDHEKSAVTK